MDNKNFKVKVTIEKGLGCDILMFRLSKPFTRDALSKFQTLKGKGLPYIHGTYSYNVKYPSPVALEIEKELRNLGGNLVGSQQAISAIKKIDQTNAINTLPRHLSVDKLLEKGVFEDIKRSIMLHNVDIIKLMEKNSHHEMDVLFDASKFIDLYAFHMDKNSVMVTGIEKLDSDEIDAYKEICDYVNVIFVASVDFNHSPEKVFDIYNMIHNYRYKDLAEFRSLNVIYNQKLKKYIDRNNYGTMIA